MKKKSLKSSIQHTIILLRGTVKIRRSKAPLNNAHKYIFTHHSLYFIFYHSFVKIDKRTTYTVPIGIKPQFAFVKSLIVVFHRTGVNNDKVACLRYIITQFAEKYLLGIYLHRQT